MDVSLPLSLSWRSWTPARRGEEERAQSSYNFQLKHDALLHIKLCQRSITLIERFEEVVIHDSRQREVLDSIVELDCDNLREHRTE